MMQTLLDWMAEAEPVIRFATMVGNLVVVIRQAVTRPTLRSSVVSPRQYLTTDSCCASGASGARCAVRPMAAEESTMT